MPEPISNQELELRSEEVQAILTKMPHWTIRWGITIIFSTIVILIIASWLIKYPDTVTSQITLTTDIPPAKIISRSAGRLQFLVKNNEKVQKNKALAYIENPADYADIQILKGFLKEFGLARDRQQGIDYELNSSLNLGEIQGSYLSFKSALENEELYQKLNEFYRTRDKLQAQIDNYRALNEQLEEQVILLRQEVTLVEKEYQIDKKLYAEKVISEVKFNQSESDFLRSQRELKSFISNKTNNSIQINVLETELLKLDVRSREENEEVKNRVNELFNALKVALANWETSYLLTSPIDGQVSFIRYWKHGQYVQRNDEVMTIVPSEQQIFGQVFMPLKGSGKVAVGQEVLIKFDNYPSREFGIVKGRVDQIAKVPRDSKYLIRTSLPDGLLTSYHKNLDFHQEMQGTAEIITEELRLIERVFNEIKSLFEYM